MDEAIAYYENMELEFSKFEEERSKKIKVVYKKTLTEMSRIAYQQEATNVKIIAAEILGLNHSIVANLRNVLKLKDQESFCVVFHQWDSRTNFKNDFVQIQKSSLRKLSQTGLKSKRILSKIGKLGRRYK